MSSQVTRQYDSDSFESLKMMYMSVAGTLLGTVARDRLITPEGTRPGDVIILTKRLAVEATSLMAREKAVQDGSVMSARLMCAAPYQGRE